MTAKVRSSTKHKNVKKLFDIEKYRSVAKYAVCSNWQAIEDDIMDDHADMLKAEKAITSELKEICVNGVKCPLSVCQKKHFPK